MRSLSFFFFLIDFCVYTFLRFFNSEKSSTSGGRIIRLENPRRGQRRGRLRAALPPRFLHRNTNQYKDGQIFSTKKKKKENIHPRRRIYGMVIEKSTILYSSGGGASGNRFQPTLPIRRYSIETATKCDRFQSEREKERAHPRSSSTSIMTSNIDWTFSWQVWPRSVHFCLFVCLFVFKEF